MPWPDLADEEIVQVFAGRRVFDNLMPGKMYRLQVPARNATGATKADQPCAPESAGKCTAEGNSATDRSTDLLLASVAVGALVAKIGSSGTLDLGVNGSLGSIFHVKGQLTVELWEAL